jgi:hypothetical protein
MQYLFRIDRSDRKTVSWFILKRILFKPLKEKVFSLNTNKNNMRKPYVVLWGPWLNSPYFVVWLVGWFMVFNATFNNFESPDFS